MSDIHPGNQHPVTAYITTSMHHNTLPLSPSLAITITGNLMQRFTRYKYKLGQNLHIFYKLSLILHTNPKQLLYHPLLAST